MATRQKFDLSFKLKAIRKAKTSSNRRTAATHGIDEKMIPEWRVQKNAFENI